ncbi:MAG TPA: hypothetical protein PKV27_12980 [Ilumatobacteraceae bacterium]|nr:hypothetical protein [Ilumatobacteraceae bacterium]
MAARLHGLDGFTADVVEVLVPRSRRGLAVPWLLRSTAQPLALADRSDSRLVARVDWVFPSGLIVELEGHATHSTRAQRTEDEGRRTELTLRGERASDWRA